SNSGPRTHSAARRVREQVLDGGERFWRHDDFGGLSPSAVATALSRLAREGELLRVRKGVYFRPRVCDLGGRSADRACREPGSHPTPTCPGRLDGRGGSPARAAARPSIDL